MALWPRILLVVAVSAVAGFFLGRELWLRPGTAEPGAVLESEPALTQVPEFQLRDLAGTTRSISEWSSHPLIINFWATWCAPCRKEMPLLEQLHQERGGRGLTIVGVAIDRDEPVQRFVTETGVTYPILVGQADAMAAAEAFSSGFVGLPMTAFAGPGGEIIKLHVGELHVEDLAKAVGILDQLVEGNLTLAQAREALRQPPSRS